MKRGTEFLLVTAGLFALLVFHFRHQLGPGDYLYLAIIEDPGARYSWFPWDFLAASVFRSGHFPLWNPYSGTGMPLAANFHSALFFPLKYFYYLYPSPRVMDAMVILRLALAGGFTFLLSRKLGLSRTAAIFSGTAFAFSGYLMKFMNVAHVANEMWLPLILLLVLCQRSRSKLGTTVLAGGVWSLTLLGGNPEAAFYAALVALIFTLILSAGKRDMAGFVIAGFVAPFVIGAMVASLQLVPFLEYLPKAWHLHDPKLHLVGSVDPRFLWSLVSPWLLGPSGSHVGQLVAPPYLGMIVFVLAALALSRMERRTRIYLFLAGTSALLLAIAYKLPPVGWLSWLPPFNRSGNIKFVFLPISLLAALLAGFGLDRAAARDFRSRFATLPLAVGALLLIVGMAHCRMKLGTLVSAGAVPSLLALLLTGMVLIWSGRKNRGDNVQEAGPGARGKKVAVIMAVLGILELMIHFQGFRVESAMLPEYLRFHDPVAPEVLEPAINDPDLPRFIGIKGALHPNLNVLSGLSDLRAFEALYPRSYVQAMARIEGFDMKDAASEFFRSGWMFEISADRLSHPLVDELGVKYAVSSEELSVDGFEKAERESGGYRLYVNREVWGRCWVEGEVGARARAGLVDYSPDRLEARADGPGEFIISDTYFPGWVAEVDGAPARIMPHEDLMRAVRLGPGPHSVVMTYRPVAFRIGLWISVISLASMIGVLVLKKSL